MKPHMSKTFDGSKGEKPSLTPEQQRERNTSIIEILRNGREKLQAKLKHYENFLETAAQFPNLENMMDAKGFIRSVRILI